MDDQRKDHIDPKRNHSKQLQTHNMPTYDVGNTNGTNKGRLFPEEQKGCRKGNRSTGELLYIDQHVLNESKMKWKNLALAWIDYKKEYDIVPQSWIINCLQRYKKLDEVINLIEKTMKTWRVEMTAGGKSLAEAKIQ